MKGLRKARNTRTLRQNKGLWGQFTGESVEHLDEAMQYLSKDELPAKVQRVVTNLFKTCKEREEEYPKTFCLSCKQEVCHRCRIGQQTKR